MGWTRTSQGHLKRGLMGICIGFVVSCCVIVVTTPLHECTHVLLCRVDPYVRVVEFHPFGVPDTLPHHPSSALPSMLGCVVIEEAYPGAFKERPEWANAVQEVICISLQVLLACLVTLKALDHFLRSKTRLTSC